MEQVVTELIRLKDRFDAQAQNFLIHIDEEKEQFKELKGQHADLMKILSDLTKSISVNSATNTLSLTWFKRVGYSLISATTIALGYLFFQIESVKMQEGILEKKLTGRIELLEKSLQHEIDKDVYYDKNRATIYQMIEAHKLSKNKK